MVAMRARDASRGLHTGVNMPGKYIHEETATPISIYLHIIGLHHQRDTSGCHESKGCIKGFTYRCD